MDRKSLRRSISGLAGLGISLLSSTSSLAIGVGEVQVKSALNQPLYASIPITANAGEEHYQDSLRVKLASPEMHKQAGLRYPQELSQTHFDLYQAVNGRTQVLVGTTQAIQEPLVTFLLEVEWSHGRLLKEISMLLDPPGYQRLPVSEPAPAKMLAQSTPKPQQIKKVKPKIVKPVELTTAVIPSTDIGSFDVPVFVEVPASLQVAQADTADYEYSRPIPTPRRRNYTITSGQYGPVRSGDTLMGIARAAAKGTGKSAKLMAQEIYESNPSAFSGSINHLVKGAELYIPDGTSTVIASSKNTEPSSQVVSTPEPAVSGVSTISDFFFNLPPEIVSGTEIEAVEPAAAKPEAATPKDIEPAAVSSSKSLEILPPDETSTQIAQEIANKLEENAKNEAVTATTSDEVAEEVEVPATNTSLKSAVGTSSMETTDTPVADAAAVIPDQESTGKALTTETDTEVETQAPIGVSIETTDMPKVSDVDVNYVDTLLKWLPWLLLMVALPLMLLLGLRKKRQPPPIKIPATSQTGLDAEPPQRSSVETYFEEPDATTEFRNPEDSGEFNSETTVLDQTEALADFNQQQPDRGTADGLVETDDLQPTATDTQETIRPTIDDAPATQIMESIDTPSEAADPELDAAQEAEIYLAYGQYSLAEAAIKRLRDSNPDSARYKLLQLKLLGETGKLEEMQALSNSLLEDADAESGLHQQIEKITDRANSRHSAVEESPTATSSASLLDPNDDSTESFNSENSWSSAAQQGNEPDTGTPSDIANFKNASEEDGKTNAKLIDTAEIASTPFVEDISDYLHEKPHKPTLSPSDNDPLIDSLSSIKPESSVSNFPLEKIQEGDFTDAELDAISMELDLMDEPGDAFEINDELSDSYADEVVENFSDTDYRLSPLGRDETSGDSKSQRLEVPFDLESEIEKLSKEDKPVK